MREQVDDSASLAMTEQEVPSCTTSTTGLDFGSLEEVLLVDWRWGEDLGN